MLRPSEAGEPAIKVLMNQDRVVLLPVGDLDRHSIETLLGLLDSARRAGVRAVVDLDAIRPSELGNGDLGNRDLLERLMAERLLSSSGRPEG